MGVMYRPVSIKKLSVHPISIILWVWLFLVFDLIVAINYFFAIFFHELGHYFAAKQLGYSLSKFSLSPYGVSLSYSQQNLLSDDEIKIAMAGPLANFATVFCVFAVWWLFPITHFFTESFVYISILLALLNLLPAYPLDGGRIFICFSSKFFSTDSAKKFTIVSNIVLSVIFFILFIVFLFINFNPSYLLFAVFLIVGVIDLRQSSKYEKVNIFTKRCKNFAKPEVLCVNGDVTIGEILKRISTNKYVIICLILENGRIINLSEKMLINLSLKYEYNLNLNEIFEKKIK